MENHISLLPSLSERILSYAHTHFWYLFKLVFPRYLCFDYGYACIPTIQSVFDIRNLFAVAVYACILLLVLFAIHRVRESVLLSLALLIIPFIPASNILFPVGTVLAERLLFISSVGFCFLIGEFLSVDLLPFWKEITGLFVQGKLLLIYI